MDQWQYQHNYLPPTQRNAGRRTLIVLGLTAATMAVELAAGYLTGSMALMADGWHMGSHAAALGITAFAYAYALRHVDNSRFSFGTGKVGSLAGYTSAVVLAVVALGMAAQSVVRFWQPVAINFDEALWVACAGLVINVVCAVILSDGHDHAYDEHHHTTQAHDESVREHHYDHNLRSAYLHVLADALTSLLAIAALAGGNIFGWAWLDPMMGIVGAALILHWSKGLLRASAAVLLDAENDGGMCKRIRSEIESGTGDRVADLHVWRIGPRSRACIVSLVTHDPLPAGDYKARLANITGLDHVTVEVNVCG